MFVYFTYQARFISRPYNLLKSRTSAICNQCKLAIFDKLVYIYLNVGFRHTSAKQAQTVNPSEDTIDRQLLFWRFLVYKRQTRDILQEKLQLRPSNVAVKWVLSKYFESWFRLHRFYYGEELFRDKDRVMFVNLWYN